MALIRDNNEYVKADLTNCIIENNMVNVPIIFYKNIAHREYEKINGQKIKTFHNNVSQHLLNLKNEIESIVNAVYSDPTLQGNLDLQRQKIENDVTLNEKISLFNGILDEYAYIKDALTHEMSNPQPLKHLNNFKSLGLEEDWLQHPIIIVRDAGINIGTIDGEINGSKIYGGLKVKMSNTTDDL